MDKKVKQKLVNDIMDRCKVEKENSFTLADYDAPWYVIPADNKWIMRSIVSTIITETIGSLKLEAPKVSASKNEMLDDARKELETES